MFTYILNYNMCYVWECKSKVLFNFHKDWKYYVLMLFSECKLINQLMNWYSTNFDSCTLFSYLTSMQQVICTSSFTWFGGGLCRWQASFCGTKYDSFTGLVNKLNFYRAVLKLKLYFYLLYFIRPLVSMGVTHGLLTQA